MKQQRGLLFLIGLMTLWCALLANAQTPGSLINWQSWIQTKHPELNCPWLISTESRRTCEWPGRLQINLDKQGAKFKYHVDTFRTLSVPLPGDANHWPQQITLQGQSVTLIDKKGEPYIHLEPGHHTITGRFNWSRRPAAIKIPKRIALVTLMEQQQSYPVNIRNGALVLSKVSSGQTTTKGETASVKVYRKLTDDIPIILETRIELSISGRPRELTLGRVLQATESVTELQSPLPARIERDGSLRIQVKPGRHRVIVKTRFPLNADKFSMHAQTPHWPGVEYWSFVSNLNLRRVKLSGAETIDTSQVDIPVEWKGLPTYQMTADTPLSISTIERGDQAPLKNRLQVSRNLWLDFEGTGYTSLDEITGEMHQQWRLNASEDTSIGRAKVGEKSVLITQDKGEHGIEIRSPNIDLNAITRIESPTRFSAVGWQSDADHYQSVIHLPPGWRILNLAGVDNVSGSWLKNWDLWDIFLVLILVFVSYKLVHPSAALLVGIMLLISYHERNNPLALWPLLLACAGLLQVVSGQFRKWVAGFTALLTILLILVTLNFSIQQFRLAIYPMLERHAVGEYSLERQRYLDSVGSLKSMSQATISEQEVKKLSPTLHQAHPLSGSSQAIDLYQLDNHDRIQTGPGQPGWTWDQIRIASTGPISAEQQIRIMYSPPWITRLWRVLSVLLVAGYAAMLLQRLLALYRASGNLSENVRSTTGTQTILILPLLFSLSTISSEEVHANEYPPEYLLQELESRMIQTPNCAPNCTAFIEGHLIATKSQLAMEITVDAAVRQAIMIPGGKGGWSPSSVQVQGTNAPMQSINNQRWILVEPGRNKLKLSGDLSGDTVEVHFPIAIHNLSWHSNDWDVEGLVDQRVQSGTLHLFARMSTASHIENSLIPDPIRPFVVVERQLFFEERWRLLTTVKRIAPKMGAISVDVPTLLNERVLSSKFQVQKGVVKAQLNNKEHSVYWESELTPTDKLTLTAATQENFVETWVVVPSSLWRLSYDGIPAIKQQSAAARLQPMWKPWPGETLNITISRPRGIKGATQTVERAHLVYTPGNHLHHSRLELEIRASRGSDFDIQLPPDAEVTSLTLNHKALNVPSNELVKVPLIPGVQTVILEFQEHKSLQWRSTTPSIQLGSSAANITLTYQLPRNRWPLYLSGPSLGPAMLYWGILTVILISACLLPIIAHKSGLLVPVSVWDWLLLGIGLSTVNSYGVFFVALFFFAMAWRKQFANPERFNATQWNGLQTMLVALTLVAILIVLSGIQTGLLASPSMSVVGNNSSSHLYHYYHDRVVDEPLPTATIINVPITVYRVVMLFWSLWIVTRLMKWGPWWWTAFSEKHLWIKATPSGEKVRTRTKDDSWTDKPKGSN